MMERGIKLSKINATFKQTFDLTPLLGKLQQHGLVKIIFDPSIDEEPFVQLTEKGRQELTELLFSNEPNKEP
jgi:DNA-binding PadR family transcriptional regulator